MFLIGGSLLRSLLFDLAEERDGINDLQTAKSPLKFPALFRLPLHQIKQVIVTSDQEIRSSFYRETQISLIVWIARVFVVTLYLSKELPSVKKNIDQPVDSLISQAGIALPEA